MARFVDLPEGSANDRHCCRVLSADVFVQSCALRLENVRKGEEWWKMPVECSSMCYVQWLLGGRDSAESCKMVDKSGKEKTRRNKTSEEKNQK
jgi:hypothetical protein